MSDTETPVDGWPTPDGETVVVRRDTDTLVGAPPPPVEPAPMPPPAAGPPPDRRVGAGMLLGIGVLVLVAAGIALAWWLSHRNNNDHKTTTVVVTNRAPQAAAKVAVPRLVGMSQNDALAQLTKAGLTPKIVYQPTKKPKGTVVSQRPAEATMLAKGTPVTLFVDSTPVAHTGSTATTTPTTPSTTGQSATTPTTTAETTTAPTTTAAAAPPPQPSSATVPDVSGQNESSAVQAFNQAGVLASLSFVPGTDELGTVEAQAKPSGTKVPYHGHVQINVSTGPGSKPMENVPNVVGQQLTQAVSTLNGAHLRLIYVKLPVTSASQIGKIVQQSPLGGGHAPENAQVLVFLGVKQQ